MKNLININKSKIFKIAAASAIALSAMATVVYATHSWGPYHWARVSNPFTLKLGDNLTTSAWDESLGTASSDWSVSKVLDTTVVAGNGGSSCRATSGRVEVCNKKYGNNGWLGIAQIWITTGNHIAKGTVKVNDTYFNTGTYNTPAWKNLVMCQEVGHTLGLDHQDEDFYNAPLGTCMDYTWPDPTPNQHPNKHDYEQLEAIYGGHLDSFTTLSQTLFGAGKNQKKQDNEDDGDLGKSIRRDGRNRTSVFEKDLGNGEKVFTFVFWTE